MSGGLLRWACNGGQHVYAVQCSFVKVCDCVCMRCHTRPWILLQACSVLALCVQCCRRFVVSVSGGPGSSAGLGAKRTGVYMRQPHEAAGPANYTVTVTPTLHEVSACGAHFVIAAICTCCTLLLTLWLVLICSTQHSDLPTLVSQHTSRFVLTLFAAAAVVIGYVSHNSLTHPHPQDAPVSDKVSIEEHLVLRATAPWVDTPDLLLLHHNGRRCVCVRFGSCMSALHARRSLKRSQLL